MRKILRKLAGAALLALLLCLTAPIALAADEIPGFPSNRGVFPEGSRLSERWLMTNNPVKPTGNPHSGNGLSLPHNSTGKAPSLRSRLSSSWGDRSYFDDRTVPWGSSRLGSSWGERSYFDDDTIPWGSGRPSLTRGSKTLSGKTLPGSIAKVPASHLAPSVSGRSFSALPCARETAKRVIQNAGHLTFSTSCRMIKTK